MVRRCEVRLMAGRQPRSGGSSVAQRVSAGDRDPIPTEPRSGGIFLDRANPHFSQAERNRRQLARTAKTPAREGARRNLAPGSARGNQITTRQGGREGGRHNNPTS